MTNDLQQAIAAIKAGDKKSGQQLLAQVVNADPQNEAAWLWMASTMDDSTEKRYAKVEHMCYKKNRVQKPIWVLW